MTRRTATRLAPLAVMLVVALAVSACLPGQVTELVARPAATGYPHTRVHTVQACGYRLDSPSGGWASLAAVSATPASVRIAGTVSGLSAPRNWNDPAHPGSLVQTPQSYLLWDGAGLPEASTAWVAPGETFHVEYDTWAVDRGRSVPAGDARVGVRVLDDAGEPLALTSVSCGTDTISVASEEVPHALTGIDWTAAQADQAAAISNGLVLPTTTWIDEFLRVLEGPCGSTFGSTALPDPLADYVLLEVDHGAPVTVGVIGDSITSQVRDEPFVADTRFNWVVASMCAARIDHFLGDPILPDLADLSFATDEVLGSDPDVVLIGLGTPDIVHRPSTDHEPEITAMMDRLDAVPCPLWIDLYPSDRPESTWKPDVGAFNLDLAAQGAAHGIPRLNWSGVTTAAGSGVNHPWLLPGPYDLIHMSVPVGHQARVGMMLAAIETCVN